MEKFVIGKVTKPKGLNGEVKVAVETDDVQNLLKVKTCFVGGKEYNIEKSYAASNGFFVKLSGINDVDAAETLRGAKFEIKREDASPLGEGEFYVADILGSSVVFENGKKVGKLVNVVNYGASDILVIRGLQKEWMLPDVEEVIIGFDDGVLTISEKKFKELAVCD